jgi:hypothetical protein
MADSVVLNVKVPLEVTMLQQPRPVCESREPLRCRNSNNLMKITSIHSLVFLLYGIRDSNQALQARHLHQDESFTGEKQLPAQESPSLIQKHQQQG